jgi:hypothetical protein
MVRIDVSFIVLAALCLLAGLLMGIGMAAAHDFQLAPIHAHLNLVGFVALSIFGLTYRAYPALARSRLALPHLVLSGVGAIVFPAGVYIAVVHQLPVFAIVGSLIVLGGVATFLANLILNLALAPAAGAVVPGQDLARSAA